MLHVDFDAILEMLERLGFQNSHYRQYYAKKRADEETAYVTTAQETLARDGEIEVDDDAEVSVIDEGARGAYVQAWVWVPRVSKEEETE